MAQVGYTPLKLYYSITTTNVPSVGNMSLGELAINTVDGKLFYKDSSAAIQVIGWKTTPTTAGGTGLTTWTAGDLPYYATGTTLSKLGIGTAGQILSSSGTAPQWSTISGVAVTTFGAGTTGFTPASATAGAITLAGTLNVANGGTGVTSSSGASSVVLRNANQNVAANSFLSNFTTVVSAGTTTTLTVASAPFYLITGSTSHTFQLPNATTLVNGTTFAFNNNSSSGSVSINNGAASPTLVATVGSGSNTVVTLLDNSTQAGSWDKHAQAPSNVTWTTNTLNYAGSITGATWNGTAVGVLYGGTGQTTASAGFNALSPITTTGDLIIGNGTNSATRLGIGTNGYVLTSNGTTATWSASTGGVTSFSAGSTGLTPSTATTGAVSLAGTLAIANGGTGQTTANTAFNALAPSQTSNSGKYLTTDGTNTSWATVVSGASLSNDTTTATNVYPLFAAATTGTPTTIYTGNAKLLYKPSTGEFQSSVLNAGNGIVVNNATISASYTIASGSNAMSVGPVTVASGQSVTVSSGQRWVVL
jgi:hypothetical protein